MASLTRYTPGLNDFFAPTSLGDAVRNLLWEPMNMFEKRMDLSIKADISEDEKAYIVTAEIPGVKKEDITVKINSNQVLLSGEIKDEKVEKKDEKLMHSERYYGQVSRNFIFDSDIDMANAKAKYEDGVLKLTLPKSGSSSKQLQIQ